jgi:alpha-tubulin suppressor-like RCC1 family protein
VVVVVVVVVVDVACGRQHTAAVDSQGRLWTWGSGREFATGLGRKDDAPHPTEVGVRGEGGGGGKRVRFVRVAAGRDFTLALSDEGLCYGMGRDDRGALGTGLESATQRVPSLVRNPHCAVSPVVHVAAGDDFSVFVHADGAVFTCGGGLSGALGHGDRADISIPQRIEALRAVRIVDAAAGGAHLLLRDQHGALYACGKGRNGQIGRGDALESVAAYRTTPVRVTALDSFNVVAIAAGSDHSLALALPRST